jgi:hypothetical protein
MNSPIIIFNPTGLTDDQVKLIKQALDDAYRAGYETAKEFYQLKLDTTITTKSPDTGITFGWPNNGYSITKNDCSHGVEQGTYASSQNEYPNAGRSDCPHMYLDNKNRALGICGLCGISFDEWHG